MSAGSVIEFVGQHDRLVDALLNASGSMAVGATCMIDGCIVDASRSSKPFSSSHVSPRGARR